MNMEEYKLLMDNKEQLSVVFSVARNQEEVFCAYDDDGIELRLPYQEYFTHDDKENNRRHAASVIRTSKNVIVKSVDEENNIVWLSYRAALVLARNEARNVIDKKLDQGETVRAKGVVIATGGEGKKSFAIIWFKSSNTRGILWCNRWSPSYVEDLKECVTEGMEVEVDIIERNQWYAELKCRYVCVRDTVIGDVWTGIEKKYQKGDIVNVKCERRWGKFYAGSIVGEKELPVRMLAPGHKNEEQPPLLIVPDIVYQCIVIAVHEENHTFRVRPLRVCHEMPGIRRVEKILTE